jgi:hypothetical protein
MQILRHSQIAVTMDIYSQVASASTRAVLSKLGSRLDFGRVLCQDIAESLMPGHR